MRRKFETLCVASIAMVYLTGCGCTDAFENVDKRVVSVGDQAIEIQMKTYNRCNKASGHNAFDSTTNHLTFSAIHGEETFVFHKSKPNWKASYLQSKRFWSAIKTTVTDDRLDITHQNEKTKKWSFVVSFSPLRVDRAP